MALISLNYYKQLQSKLNSHTLYTMLPLSGKTEQNGYKA